MASKKGVIITALILVVITISSFLVWMIPQENQQTFVITNYEKNLDDIKEIHGILVYGIESEFQKMLSGEISPDEYINAAEISSSQLQAQIIQLVESKAPEQWQQSYLNYLESLRSTNSQIRETIVVAKMIKDDKEQEMIDSELKKIDELKSRSQSYAVTSDDARP